MITSTKPIKPFNAYNLFYILERALLIESLQNASETSSSSSSAASSRPSSPPASSASEKKVLQRTGYEAIDLPPLPPRYRSLEGTLPANWYDPGRNKVVKRKHTKSHGVASFREIAKHVADTWREIDPVTKDFAMAVTTLLKRRFKELNAMAAVASAYEAPRCPNVVPGRTVSPGECRNVFPQRTVSPSDHSWNPNKIAHAQQMLATTDVMPYVMQGIPSFPAINYCAEIPASSADFTPPPTGGCPSATSSASSSWSMDRNALRIDKDLILDPNDNKFDNCVRTIMSMNQESRGSSPTKEVDFSDTDILKMYLSI